MRIFGTHDDATRAQLIQVAEHARKVALMADGHVGYVMPIGGVAAYHNAVSVVGVGFDIACGNAAIRTDQRLTDLGRTEAEVHDALAILADPIAGTVSFGIGGRTWPMTRRRPTLSSRIPRGKRCRPDTARRSKPRRGTNWAPSAAATTTSTSSPTKPELCGSGCTSAAGFGHTVASSFLALGQGKSWGERAPATEVLLGLDQPVGHDYWHLMNLAGRYAYAGREWVARKVVQILGANEVELVHNHHNFAWQETHEGEELVVVRKGATPAFPGQKGFIGGSMGDDAVIVQGVVSSDPVAARDQKEALFSTVHGAGRVMSRTAAAGKRNRRTGKVLSRGRVTLEMMHAWVREKGVILRGGGLDESPHVYRRLPEVLAAQGNTIEVLHTLRPLIVVMAGADEFDPYKD